MVVQVRQAGAVSRCVVVCVRQVRVEPQSSQVVVQQASLGVAAKQAQGHRARRQYVRSHSRSPTVRTLVLVLTALHEYVHASALMLVFYTSSYSHSYSLLYKLMLAS